MKIDKEYEKEIGELVKLIGKRWDILAKLLEMKKSYMSELSKELKKSIQQLHFELKELEKKGLVKSEQDKKERRKYYRITDYSDRILTAIDQAFWMMPREKLEEWHIDMLLDVLQDRDRTDTLRLSYSESFHRICLQYPIEVISYQQAREFLERILTEKSTDKVEWDLKKRSLSAILSHVSRHKEWCEWVMKEVYPALLEYVEDEEEESRIWAIQMMGRIATNITDSSIKDGIVEKLLEIWFSRGVDPSSKFGNELFCLLLSLSSRKLFKKVMVMAKTEENRKKAEMLLERLKDNLLPCR